MVFVGPQHCSERWLEGLILDEAKNHTIANDGQAPHARAKEQIDMAGISYIQPPPTLRNLGAWQAIVMLQAQASRRTRVLTRGCGNLWHHLLIFLSNHLRF